MFSGVSYSIKAKLWDKIETESAPPGRSLAELRWWAEGYFYAFAGLKLGASKIGLQPDRSFGGDGYCPGSATNDLGGFDAPLCPTRVQCPFGLPWSSTEFGTSSLPDFGSYSLSYSDLPWATTGVRKKWGCVLNWGVSPKTRANIDSDPTHPNGDHFQWPRPRIFAFNGPSCTAHMDLWWGGGKRQGPQRRALQWFAARLGNQSQTLHVSNIYLHWPLFDNPIGKYECHTRSRRVFPIWFLLVPLETQRGLVNLMVLECIGCVGYIAYNL